MAGPVKPEAPNPPPRRIRPQANKSGSRTDASIGEFQKDNVSKLVIPRARNRGSHHARRKNRSRIELAG